jgi:hypothetical protein
LFQRRREIVKSFGSLSNHITILDALGPDGMSSDESVVDLDMPKPSYTVIKPDWRHPDLHNWLKLFDQLHHRNHVDSWFTDKRGAFPHIRTGSQKVHKKKHVPAGLPINAYDPKWLESRQEAYLKYVLCPKMEQYNFNHPLDVIA